MQLAWSPAAKNGTFVTNADGKAEVRHTVEGSEKMGNGSGLVLHGLAALTFAETVRLPVKSLTIRELFPGDPIVFPFGDMPKDARRNLKACLSETDAAYI